jgi:hypothetical protein
VLQPHAPAHHLLFALHCCMHCCIVYFHKSTEKVFASKGCCTVTIQLYSHAAGPCGHVAFSCRCAYRPTWWGGGQRSCLRPNAPMGGSSGGALNPRSSDSPLITPLTGLVVGSVLLASGGS